MSKTDKSTATRKRQAKPYWKDKFLAALADTSNVSASARAAGVSTTRAYRTRREDDEFANRWQEALCEGYDNLEMDLLHRMRTGEVKPAPGAKRGVRQFDNAVALRLLAAHRESAARQRAVRANVSAAEVRASIEKKVEALRKRVLEERRRQPE